MKDKVSTAIILETRNPKKDGTFPVKLRVTWNRIQRYYSINQDLTKSDFESSQKPRPKGQHRKYALYFAKVESRAIEIIDEIQPFSFDVFSKRFKKKGVSQLNVYRWFDEKIESLVQDEKHGTAETYKAAASSIKEFSKKENILFQEITTDWLKKYERKMIKDGKSKTTIGIYLRHLRAIFNLAKKQGIISEDIYPFNNYTIPKSANIKKALSLNEIKLIFDYSSEHDKKQWARDIFIFSYLCNGINMADISRLKNKDISDGSIVFIRQKTESTSRNLKPIIVPVNQEIEKIINRWRTSKNPSDYTFPILSSGMEADKARKVKKEATKQVNKYLKIIASELDIDKNLTTYYARHSFATVLKRSGTPIEYISEALGHSDLKVTENYLDSFENKQRKEYQKNLLNFDDIE